MNGKLKTCKTCNNTFAVSVETCPICGAAQSKLIEIIKKIGIIKIIVIFLVVYIVYASIIESSSTLERPLKTKNIETRKATMVQKPKAVLANRNSLFDPNKTCNNFIFDGYYHYQWKIIADSWSCSSISENGMSSRLNEVTFYAESNRSDKIESIEILAEIFDVSIEEKIIKEFKNKLKEFFKKSDIKFPSSLINHINIEANYNLTMSDVDISFKVDRSFPDGIYQLVLTIKANENKEYLHKQSYHGSKI